MADDPTPEQIDVSFDHPGRPLAVRGLRPGWRVKYGDRLVVEPHLDRALARALGIPPGATHELLGRILRSPSTDTRD